MQKLTSTRRVRELLEKHNLKPRKNWGQNFLVDENILVKIVDAAELSKDDRVLEIGPGLGVLTMSLAERAAEVIAVEIDQGLFSILEQNLADFKNVKLVQGDVRKLDLSRLCRESWGEKDFVIVANLPYYLTTPFIFQVLKESTVALKRALFMVQREVAQRMVALPGSSNYGTLSILCRYYTEPEYLFNVPQNVFFPRPAVESAVVRLVIRQPKLDVGDQSLFWELIKGVFQMRRKTVLKGLLHIFPLSRETGEEILTRAGIPPQLRPEKLSIEQFAKLSRILYNLRG
ncbi:MAG: 16S rRNA (adenine(1518)-N(6)/adenine(1519)-N(6))-dimethyltransferase RsmA [Dethiobacteria bacterium]|jgi:16S rRNA (adenine1518-N6/adenine1519-N6)-dimethyltransferase|nr:16S rRNA (adenine(1518)-N(6)/adenine(1519)-N(6))-dimethyltransferase RsmA [Bacillota bacterium]